MAKPSLKRFLPLFAGVGLVAASASTVVSCTAPQYAAGIDGQRVVVVTDGGHINDHSFNEDAYLGVKNFVANAYVKTHQVVDPKDPTKITNEPIKDPATGKPERLDGSNDYVEAGGTDTTSVVSGYRLAVVKKANAIVLPGFAHVNSLPAALPFLHKHNVNVVLVDGVVKDPNVVSLQFNSQISGVMAGFDTSYLFGTSFNANGKLTYDTNGDNQIKIGTFAGASNKYGVDNYMWGLLLGMQIYNDVAQKHNDDPNNKDKWAIVKSANNDSGEIKDIQTQNDTDSNFYTNSFALGDATKTGIISKLVDKHGADVIFPVAGPQIQDVLSFKRQSGKEPYVIGVDVDQAAAYPNGEGRFVTSAIKNIDTAVPEALYRASTADDNKGNTLEDFGTTIGGSKAEDSDKTKYGNFNSGSHWLGESPEPFVNWSIDFTNDNAPQHGHYLLKKNHIKLYGNNTMTVASGAMKEINDHFAALGIHSVDYMNGKDIYKFANDLITKYKADMNDGVLDWYSSATKDGE